MLLGRVQDQISLAASRLRNPKVNPLDDVGRTEMLTMLELMLTTVEQRL